MTSDIWLKTSLGRLAVRQDGPEGGVPLLPLQRFRGTLDDWDPLSSPPSLPTVW